MSPGVFFTLLVLFFIFYVISSFIKSFKKSMQKKEFLPPEPKLQKPARKKSREPLLALETIPGEQDQAQKAKLYAGAEGVKRPSEEHGAEEKEKNFRELRKAIIYSEVLKRKNH